MNHVRTILSTLSAIVLALFIAAPAAAQDGADGTATAFVQAKAELIIAILNQTPGTDEEREARRENLRTSIRGFLDFDVLAERTLGDHWASRTAEERTEFVDTLRELIESSYSSRLSDAGVSQDEYTVTWLDERSRSDRYRVELEVSYDGETHFLEVKLMQTDTGFLIYDLVTDDVSLEESYAESFDNIIGEHGWDELLRRMRDRTEDFETP